MPAPAPPLALVERVGQAVRLAAVCPRAAALGLRPGQAQADALAMVPDLACAPADPGAEARLLVRLALWAGRWTPAVAIDRFDRQAPALLLDLTGCAHLWGGEAALLADIRARLARLGIPARLALAGTPGAAWALARFGPDGAILAPGEEAPALAPLPVAALRLETGTVAALHRFGLERVGALERLPRAALARRFRARRTGGRSGRAGGAAPGMAGMSRSGGAGTSASAAGAGSAPDPGADVLAALDRALGRCPEPLVPVRPAPAFAERLALPEPLVAHGALRARLPGLAARLAERLGAAGQGARRLRLMAWRVDGRRLALEVALAVASRDPAHWLRLIDDRGVERLDLGFGVDALGLEAVVAEPLAPAQAAALAGEGGDHAARLAALADRLAARLGEGALLAPAPGLGWLPERAWRWVPWVAGGTAGTAGTAGAAPGPEAGPPAGPDSGSGVASGPTGGDVATAGGRAAPVGPSGPALPLPPAPAPAVDGPDPGPPRPLLLLPRPEPVEAVAEIPDGAPARFTWRGVARRVVRASGPERIAPEWWRALGRPRPPRTRDYYRVEDETGARWWLFRAGLWGRGEAEAPRWWLHGLFA
jgi:protein ImuB